MSRTIGQQACESIGSNRRIVLTRRDRELFVHLAIARYLSGEQIRNLVFPGKADSVTRRRLSALVSGKFPYIRRLAFRTREGRPVIAWSMTPLGYMAARNVFPAIPDRRGVDAPGDAFLEHEVRLNDLYVALASGARQNKLTLDRWPFRWVSGDFTHRRWTEESEQGKSIHRAMGPDAMVELPREKHRIFIELEAGPQLLDVHRNGRNAIKTKMELYRSFMATSYSTTFSDSWSAELIFVVPTKPWCDAIAEHADGSWRPTQQAPPFFIRATTLEGAPAYLCQAAQLPVVARCVPDSKTAGTLLAPEDIRALYEFYNEVIARIGAMRRFAKSHPQFASSLPLPDYPSNHQVVRDLCLRLGSALR